MPSNPPLVLVAHGSPDPRSAATVRRIAASSEGLPAFLDFDEPAAVPSLTDLADAGHREVVLVPLLLTRAFHGRVDIPRVVAAAVAARPHLRVRLGAPVGDPLLLSGLARDLPPCDGVVLATAGTRDERARDGIEALARTQSIHSGIPWIPAYASAAKPDVAQAIAQLRARGARRVAVASYFIAEGKLHDRVREAADRAGAVAVTPVLGDRAELIEVIGRRRHSTPSASLVDGAIRSTTMPAPSAQAITANSHSPALAR
jgi:sirohydrochlorin ferrochelatase